MVQAQYPGEPGAYSVVQSLCGRNREFLEETKKDFKIILELILLKRNYTDLKYIQKLYIITRVSSRRLLLADDCSERPSSK